MPPALVPWPVVCVSQNDEVIWGNMLAPTRPPTAPLPATLPVA